MTPTEIRGYIDARPELVAMAGNDTELANAMNAITSPVVGGVSRSRFAMWAGKTGMRSVIQDHADDYTSPLRSSSLTLLDFLQGGVADSLDLSDADNQNMLSAWVAAGGISQNNVDELVALATTQQPIAGRMLSNIDIAHSFGRG